MNLLVLVTSVAALLAKGTDGLYLVKKQEFASTVNPGMEWSKIGGSRGSDGRVLRRAPVRNLAPQDAPGPAVVGLPIVRNAGIYTAGFPVGHAQKVIQFQVSTSVGDTIIHGEKTLYARFGAIDLSGSDKTWCQVVNPTCDTWGTPDNGSLEPYDDQDNTFVFQINPDHLAMAGLFTDYFIIGGKTIPKVPFGVPLVSTLDTNFLGLGFVQSEAGRKQYPNLPQVIKNNKLTKVNAYSVWLNTKSARSGGIVFGGYDAAKHTGHFAHLALQAINGKYSECLVPTQGVLFGKAKKTLLTTPMKSASLDLGSPITLLPRKFAEDMGKAAGATLDDNGYFIIDCTFSDKVYMVVNFGSVKITLLADDLVLPKSVTGTPPGKCFWGVFPTDDRPVLGNNFLRRAYVVFDLDHRILSIAQTAYSGASRGYEIPEDGLQALGELLGLGDPDPDLERIAGDMESDDEEAENSDTLLGDSEALNTGIDASNTLNLKEDPQRTPGAIDSASSAAGTEPTYPDASEGQTTNSFIPTTNAFAGTFDGSTFNPDGPAQQFTAQLPSTLFPGTESAGGENGIASQSVASTTDNDERLNAGTHSSASDVLAAASPSTAGAAGGSGEPPTTGFTTADSNQATPEALLGDNGHGLGVDMASAITPGGGAQNLFVETNAT